MKRFAPACLIVILAGCRAGVMQAQAPAGRTCAVDRAPLTPAGQAMAHGDYKEAETLYAAMPPSSAATAGLIRAKIGSNDLKGALTLALQQVKAHPDDGVLLDALGEIRYRRGEVDEAAAAYTRAVALEPCLPLLRYDMARHMQLSGLYASARQQVGLAHSLAPGDKQITALWKRSQPSQHAGDAKVLAQMQEELDEPGIAEERKALLTNRIASVRAHKEGTCQLVSSVETAKIAMLPLGNAHSSEGSTAAGVDVQFNGKHKRLLLDTGASGLVITQSAARTLGLVGEAESRTGGIGDEGSNVGFVTHVDDIKIGPMNFRHCEVRVLGKSSIDSDGLIGTDVFSAFLIALDLPAYEMKLSPLPRRADETAAEAGLDTASDLTFAATEAATGKDRYIAPEMKDWTKVFRSGHLLILPTSIGRAPLKLFALDTGSAVSLISPAAAREVTGVGVDDSIQIKGLSGNVNEVSSTDAISVTFARTKVIATGGLTAIDTSHFTRDAGVELSGFIGYEILRQFVISIDYRDNLVKLAKSNHVATNLSGLE